MFSSFSVLYKIVSAFLKDDFIDPFQYGSGYDEIASAYLWNSRVGYHSRLLLDNTEPDAGKLNILDLGCGTGYLTQQMASIYPQADITGIDTSRELLEIAEKKCHERIKFVHDDVASYLEKCPAGSVDAVYSAWAWPYFASPGAIGHINRALKPGGLLGVISNRKGTLKGLEKNFIKVMFKRSKDFIKPMKALRNLPKDIAGFEKAFKKQGFYLQTGGEGEVRIQKETIEALWAWIHDAGVSAGVSSVFRNWESVKKDFLVFLEKDLKKSNGYVINHSFLWCLMRKGGTSC